MPELSAAANPLHRDNVVSALVAAAGNDQQHILAATQQLQAWGEQPGFYSLLQDVFTDYSLPTEVRYLSIIQMKNGIDRYWRKAARHAIKPEEKLKLKTRAVEAGALEPDARLALHNALAIAKILRYEFPTEWPDAITALLQLLRTSTQPGTPPVQLPRVLLMVLRTVKELSTARLLKTQKALRDVAPEMLHVLSSIYVSKVNEGMTFLESGNGDALAAVASFETSHLALKSMRRLMTAGFEHPNRDKMIQETWSLTLSHFASFYPLTSASASQMPQQVHTLLQKHLLQLSKLHLDMANTHPAAFALLPDSIRLVQSYWGLVVELGPLYGISDLTQIGANADEEEPSLLHKVALKALLLVRACVRLVFYPAHTFKYPKAEDKEEKNQSVEIMKTQLLNEEFVVQAMELLVTKLFRFSAEDLQMWEDEPEEWEKQQEEISDAWEFSIRSCAEKLFLDLVINYKTILGPRLINVFNGYATLENRDLLLKDSIYCAIGLAAPVLEKHLEFNLFLESTLVQEAQLQYPGYNIIRRRIALLLAEWVPVKHEGLSMDKVYGIFQYFLSQGVPLNDTVVRLTAARKLKDVLEPFEFDPATFQPFITPILSDVLGLIEQTSLVETKMALLETVRLVVVKMEDHISPFTDRIINLLPPLWESAGDEFLMKQAILTLITSIIHSLKDNSLRYHPLILPLIYQSSDPEVESSAYLLEEALDLWAAIVIQAPSPASPELLSLFPCLLKILDSNVESVRQALEITQSYIFIAPQEVLSDNIRLPLLTSLNNLLNVTAKQRLGIVPLVGEQIVRTIEMVDATNEQAYAVMAKSLIDSGFMPTILAGIRDAYEANQTTGPNKKSSLIFGVMETDYLSVLARLALASPAVFIESVSAVCSGQSQQEAINWLLTEWFSHFDNIGDVNRKKMHALALTRLLSVNGATAPAPSYLLNHLQSYMSIWTDLMTELADGADAQTGGDYLIYWNDEQNGTNGDKFNENEPPEETRRRAWEKADPVFRVNLRQFVGEILTGVIQTSGGVEAFKNEWLVNVDIDVINSFRQYITL